ncbi:MAG: nitroreductase family protein [Bacteroidales bacterium]|nr:nitroreductase family protein [Bacteroidales bacterium]
MNPTVQTLLQHRSIRKFTEQPVDSETIETILKCACNGSTMGNMQLFSIIVTTDKKMMEKTAALHFNQPIATNAPLMLTFCADLHRFNRYCQFRNASTDSYDNLQAYQWATTDALIAAQNACVAAESLGLGLCWLGTIVYQVDKFIEILSLPKNVMPVACIALGYPDENPELTDKLPVEALVHHNVYQDYSEFDINKYYKEKENHPNTINILKENELDNLAQVFTQRRYVKKDNEFFSQVLKKTLVDQHFLDE